MDPEPLADQLTLHMLQTKMGPSLPGQVGADDTAQLFRSYIVSSVSGWPNHGRHLISLSYPDSIDGGFPNRQT